MGLCERCARILDEFKAFVKKKTANFVNKLKDVAKKLSECCCLKKSVLPKEKSHELQRRHVVKTSGYKHRPHLYTAQSNAPIAFLKTCCSLMQSEDLEVHRGISQSMVNLLMDSKIKEEQVIEMGLLEPLVDLLQSGDHTVQCSSSSCIALLASSDVSREAIVSSNAVLPLLSLARAFEPKVQLNAVKALFNLTKTERIMRVLCEEGVIPVLVLLLESADSEVQFYSCCALTNIASAPENHVKMLQIGNCFLLKSLMSLMGSSVLRNSTQACQCLRNFTGIDDVQQQLVGLDFVSPLLTLLKAPEISSIQAALMLLSELSGYSAFRESLVNKQVMYALGQLLLNHSSNPTVVNHCANTLTHMWDIVDSQQGLLENMCLAGLLLPLGVSWNEDETLLNVISCLHSLACFESLRSYLVEEMTEVHVAGLVKICSETDNPNLSFAAGSVIGKLDMNDKLIKPHHRTIVGYLTRYLRNQEVRFQQLAIACVYDLQKFQQNHREQVKRRLNVSWQLNDKSLLCRWRAGRCDGLNELEREVTRVQQMTERTKQLLQMLQQD